MDIKAFLSQLVDEAEADVNKVITPEERAKIKAWLANNATSTADEYKKQEGK